MGWLPVAKYCQKTWVRDKSTKGKSGACRTLNLEERNRIQKPQTCGANNNYVMSGMGFNIYIESMTWLVVRQRLKDVSCELGDIAKVEQERL